MKYIKIFFITIILLGFITAGIDYSRMNSGNTPMFNLKKYDEKTKIQTFRGLFYVAERKVSASVNESLVDSSEMHFAVLIFELKVPRQFKEIAPEYNVITKETANCIDKAELYYANKDIKVYTYCLDKIEIKEKNTKKELINYLEKDTSIIDEIDSKLMYRGLYSDKTTLVFTSPVDYTNNGLKMFRCNKPNINDAYIGPENMIFQKDFCTYKDDDFKFMWTIKEEPLPADITLIEEQKKPEPIFEDEIYRYELSEHKSDRIFVVTPAVRGKEEKKYPIKQIINKKILTIEELKEKGLKYNKIDKKKEAEELKKKAEEEAKKAKEAAEKARLEREQNNQNNNQ